MAQLIPKFLASAFERMGNSDKALEQVAINTGTTAAAVSVGGDLYEKMDELVKALGAGGGGKKGDLSIKEALVLRITAGALEPIGLGLGVIIDALERAPDGKELKLKMEALTNGLLALGDVGYSIVKFAAMMILALPLLIVAGVAMLLIVPILKLMVDGLMWATKKLDKKQLKKIAMLGEIGANILILAVSLVLVGLLATFAMKGVLVAAGIMLGLAGVMLLLDKMGFDPKGMNKFAKALKNLALGILGLSVGLILIGFLTQPILIGLATAMLVILTIGGVFWLMNKLKIAKSMRKTSRALVFAAMAILSVSVALVLSALIVKSLGWLEVGKVLLLVGAVALTFFVINKVLGKQSRKGAMLMIFAAGAILAVAVAIFLARLLIGPVNAENILETFGVLVVIGAVALVFGIAGLAHKFIKKGAIALAFAGGAMIVIAIGVFAMKKAIDGMSWGNLGMIAAIIVGLGLAMGIAGAGPLPGFIALGSAAMIVAGIALVVIGAGVMVFAKALKDMTWEKVGMMGAIIGGVAVAMGLAGLGAIFIAAGAAVMILAGVALITLGKGLEIIAKVDFNKLGNVNKRGSGAFNDSGEMTSGFLGMFKRKKTNFEVAIESIVDSMSLGPLSIIGVLAGAPVVLLAGAAMIKVAQGLGDVQKLTEKVNLKTLGKSVGEMVFTIADAFGAIGKKYPGGKQSLFSSIMGGGGGSFVSQGVSSTMGMGSALSGIARGMQAMANLKFPVKYDKEGNPIEFESMDSDAPVKVAVNAAMITGVLADVFGRIGKKYPGGKKSLFAQIMTGKGNSPVADGISSVQGMGSALTNVAKGFQAMAMLNFPVEWDEEGKPIKFETMDIKTNGKLVMDNTKEIVKGLSAVFGEIGSNPDAESSWWGGKSKIQKGIDLVTGVGTPLINLAKGVQNMASLKFPKGFDADGKATGYDTLSSPAEVMEKVTGNTKMLIRALVEVFTEIGGMSGTSSDYWWWDNSKFTKGAELVTTMSTPYQKLGTALKEVMASVGKMDTKSFAGKMQDIIKVFVGAGEEAQDTKLLDHRRWYIKAMGSSFEKMKTAVPAIVKGANGFDKKRGAAFFSSLIGATDKGQRVQGYDAQKKLWYAIGHSTTKMSTSMPGIAQAINNMDLAKLTEARTMFEALAVLSEGGNPNDILAKMGESLEEAMWNLGEMLQTVASSMQANTDQMAETSMGSDGSNAADDGGSSNSGGSVGSVRMPSQMAVKITNLQALARVMKQRY